MTVGYAVLIYLATIVVISLLAAPLVQRYENGHWGAKRWLDVGYLDAVWMALRGCLIASLVTFVAALAIAAVWTLVAIPLPLP